MHSGAVPRGGVAALGHDASFEAAERQARAMVGEGPDSEFVVGVNGDADMARQLSPRLGRERTQIKMVASALSQEALLTDSFHLSRCMGMLLLHITLPVSIPVAIYTLGLRPAQLCEIVPTSVAGFFNTNGLVLAQYFSLVTVLVEPDLQSPVLLAFLGTGAMLWLFRQIMIGVKYGYMPELVWTKFRSGVMGREEFQSQNLGTWFSPPRQAIARQMLIAFAGCRQALGGAQVLFIKQRAINAMLGDCQITADGTNGIASTNGIVKTTDLLSSLAHRRSQGRSPPVWANRLFALSAMAGSTAAAFLNGEAGTRSVTPVEVSVWVVMAYPFYMSMNVTFSLMAVGVEDLRRRLWLLRHVDGLLSPRARTVESETGFGTPTVRDEGAPLALNSLENCKAWIYMRLVAKEFGKVMLARVQSVYAVWYVLSLMGAVLLAVGYLSDIDFAGPTVTMAFLAAMTLYRSAQILLLGAMVNDLGFETCITLDHTAHRLLEHAVTMTSRAVAQRKSTTGKPLLDLYNRGQCDAADVHPTPDVLKSCHVAVRCARELVAITSIRNPITFLGVPANRTLLNSLASVVLSGAAVGVRYAVPTLVDLARNGW